MQITPAEVAETLAMVSKQNLDIRTITLGINLRGCVDADVNALASKVYDRMTSAAEKLVPTAEQLEREFGIPIVNKRISVTPIAEICAAVTADDLTPVAVAMDRAGKEVGVDFVGGFSALVHKGATRADHKLMDSIPTALAATDRVCASVNVGSTRAGINMDAAFKMAGVIKRAAELTADRQCIGAGKLVVFCNAVEDNPFMAGAFHGSGEADEVVNVGVSGPGVVRAVLADLPKEAGPSPLWPRPLRPRPSRSPAPASSWPARPRAASVCSRASWICRSPPPRPRGTPWPRFWRPSAWVSAEAPAPRRRSPC